MITQNSYTNCDVPSADRASAPLNFEDPTNGGCGPCMTVDCGLPGIASRVPQWSQLPVRSVRTAQTMRRRLETAVEQLPEEECGALAGASPWLAELVLCLPASNSVSN